MTATNKLPSTTTPAVAAGTTRLAPYVPRIVRHWVTAHAHDVDQQVDGTVAFIDISGFTKLSEHLARNGREGAEQLTDVIGGCFRELLAVADDNDGSLVKFGGDALLLLFTGAAHAERACRAAGGMRERLRTIGLLHTPAGRVRLRMSVGVHSGTFHFFLAGDSHRELLITGPAATETVLMESIAGAGDIVVSAATAALLPPAALGAAKGTGRLLRRAPTGGAHRAGQDPAVDDAVLVDCIPRALRDRLGAGVQAPEHRRVTVAFVRFEDVDDRIRTLGPAATAEQLDRVLVTIQGPVDRHGITFLGTDIDRDGGKVLLACGAPATHGDDQERMLLALREIADTAQELPLRIGVNSGPVFAGDVGPSNRRCYTVMGDAVNLAARLMARAGRGQILATASVLEPSRTRFDTEALEPFTVKGKSRPVQAWAVGPVTGPAWGQDRRELPLIGRGRELQALTDALEAARGGQGRLVEIVGEPGIGKSRLVDAFRAAAGDARQISVDCEPYASSTPYFPFRTLLRAALGLRDDAGAAAVAAALHDTLSHKLPELLAWEPLLAIPLDVQVAATEQTAQLEERYRRPRLHDAVERLLAATLPATTVLVISDVHWMDEASAELLTHLAGRLTDRPWLVCVTRRDTDTGFVTAPGVVTLSLAPLDASAVAALAEVATDESPLAQHEMAVLVERSGGNPLFLRELVAAARIAGGLEQLPDSIESVVTARIDRLPVDARTVLRYVSVLGHAFARELAAAVLPQSVSLEDDGLWRRLGDFLAADGPTIRFRHALIRDAAYGGLPYRVRRRLHASVGQRIERGAGRPDDRAELLSFHFFHAQRHAEAWRYSLVAAESAAAIYANADAVRFYERALEAARGTPDLGKAETARVHELLGDIHERMGAYREAVIAYRAARRVLPPDPRHEARLILKEARQHGRLSRNANALRWIRRGFAVLKVADTPAAARQRAELSVWYAHFCQEQGRHRLAIRWAHRAISEGEPSGAKEALAHAYRVLDRAYVDLGKLSAAVYSPLALEIYEELGNRSGQADVLNNLGGFAYFEGRWDDALAYYERAKELWRRTGDEAAMGFAMNNIGEILAAQGRTSEAEPLFRDALRAWRAAGLRSKVASANQNLARIALRDGRAEQARAMLTEAKAEFEDVGATVDIVETECRLAEVALFQRAWEEALSLADGALLRAKTVGGTPQEPELHRIRAYALMHGGDLAAARDAVTTSLELGRERAADYEVALSLRASGQLHALERAASATGLASPADDTPEMHESAAIMARLGVVEVAAPFEQAAP